MKPTWAQTNISETDPILLAAWESGSGVPGGEITSGSVAVDIDTVSGLKLFQWKVIYGYRFDSRGHIQIDYNSVTEFRSEYMAVKWWNNLKLSYIFEEIRNEVTWTTVSSLLIKSCIQYAAYYLFMILGFSPWL